MFIYSKTLQRPMNVSRRDPNMAMNILTAYGGPDGEAGAGTRYLTQRYAMPLKEGKAILTDVGTEELGHLEMVGELFTKLIDGATKDEMIAAGFDRFYVEHGCNPFYVNPSGQTFNEYAIGSKGNPVVDLYEDMAAEQKARLGYENLIKLTNDKELQDSLKFLREREVVHFQRFGETLRLVEEFYGNKTYYFK